MLVAASPALEEGAAAGVPQWGGGSLLQQGFLCTARNFLCGLGESLTAAAASLRQPWGLQRPQQGVGISSSRYVPKFLSHSPNLAFFCRGAFFTSWHPEETDFRHWQTQGEETTAKTLPAGVETSRRGDPKPLLGLPPRSPFKAKVVRRKIFYFFFLKSNK